VDPENAANQLLVGKRSFWHGGTFKEAACGLLFLRSCSGESKRALPNYLDAENAPAVSTGKRSEVSWDPVYRQVKKIPRGHVSTYGEVAKAMRLRAGARAVGYALAACPRGQGIPWHRVLGAGGRIRVPEPHAALQRKLLESEGVQIGVTVDMKIYGWSFRKSKAAPAPKKKRIKPGR
jgi:methylated-DNA-protein-cysteine methyltransferase related protein